MCIAPKTALGQNASASASSADAKKSVAPVPMNNIDYTQPRREHAFMLPKFMCQWITEHMLRQKDERNLFILMVGINIAMTSVPAAISIFFLERNQVFSPAVLKTIGMVYALAHMKTWARSYMLALHYITHCSIFNLRFRFLDGAFNQVLGFFFGIPPGLYYPHHIGMHHSEDNMAPNDMSSTMDYNRGSKWQHLKYCLRYLLISFVELPYRLISMGKYNLALQSSSGILVYLGVMIYLYQQHPIATVTTMYVPWVIISFGLTHGNFKEHVFVDPAEPDNNYKSAFSCMNAPSNAKTFNTGYHIEHHEEPGLPWYKLPDLFLKNLDKHAKNDSFTFDGIGSMEVGNLVLKGDFDTLADHYINVGQPKRTKPELIKEFKRRLLPVFPSQLPVSKE